MPKAPDDFFIPSLRTWLVGLGLTMTTLAASPALAAQDMDYDQPEAFATLKKAVSYFDEMDTLPEEAWISRDQASARNDMDEMIEEAMQALDVPELSTLRSTYRQVEDKIRESRSAISELKEQRILAPDTADHECSVRQHQVGGPAARRVDPRQR